MDKSIIDVMPEELTIKLKIELRRLVSILIGHNILISKLILSKLFFRCKRKNFLICHDEIHNVEYKSSPTP